MRLGIKTLLFGCHQVLLHPVFTLIGWVRMYGWSTLNLEVIVAIITHDWGYWWCYTMDDDGLIHPLMLWPALSYRDRWGITKGEVHYHSRHLSAILGEHPSRLCWADKLGVGMMPSWLWAALAYASGEGWEYMINVRGHDYVEGEDMTLAGLWRFHRKYKAEWGIGGRRWETL